MSTTKTFLLIVCVLTVINNLSAQKCGSTYLFLPARASPSDPQRGVSIGDLDITGNQLTVEALVRVNSSQPFAQGGDIVSKHCSASDVNYLLRPRSAHITTTNGYFSVVSDTCLQINKNYHIAMTYNGSWLRLYSNGVLIGETAATGNLVTNNLSATIGREACEAVETTDFNGFIDEVRIWNTARTQAQIQQYMTASIPSSFYCLSNLKGYYIFNSLQNIICGTSYDGTIQGNVELGRPNPTCPVMTTVQCPETQSPPLNPPATLSCTNFLRVDAEFSGVTVGDLDIGGSQITVEAVFKRTTSYDPAGEGGDLVSKHSQASDANYFLRPNAAAIRVGTTFYKITSVCPAEVGQTYHVALVYDGSTFSFYRNGEIQGSLSTVGGNLGTNAWLMRIGTEANQTTTLPIHFIGYINEVRIWSVARSFDSIYYNYRRALPGIPPGLVAYYNFDNLDNKVGSGLWNGTILGTASVGQTVPDCSDGVVTGPLCIPLAMARRNPRPPADQPDVINGTIIYPNPATNIAHVRFNNTIDRFVTIRILDMSGKLLTVQKEATNIGINNIRIRNIEALKPGVYIVQVNGQSESVQKKLIIQ